MAAHEMYMYPVQRIQAECREETVMRQRWFIHAGGRCRQGVILLAVLLGATGCVTSLHADPPGLEVPRISQLSITPPHVAYGCPVTLRFRFEDPHGDLVRAHVAWRVSHLTRGVGARVLTLPIDAAQVAGKTTGGVSVPLRLEQYGTTVWYDVQVEDAAGRKSNVLTTSVLMNGPLPWREPPSECS